MQRNIVGTWKLIRAESRNTEHDPWTPDFGLPLSGYFFYDVNGYNSVQIMSNPPQPTYDPDKGPGANEALVIFNNYINYYGTIPSVKMAKRSLVMLKAQWIRIRWERTKPVPAKSRATSLLSAIRKHIFGC